MSKVIESLPRRSFVYAVVALGIVSFSLIQKYTLLEFLQSLVEALLVCELGYRSLRVLWQAYRYGALFFVVLGAMVATFAVRSLIGGVSDDLPTMVIGFGVPVFLAILVIFALLIFIARRAERTGADH